MSTVATPIFDVFLAHGRFDKGLALLVTEAFQEAGLETFAAEEFAASGIDEIRARLAESDAMVLVLTRSTLNSQDVAFLVGAALGWSKPVYVVYDGLDASEIPDFLRGFDVKPIGRLPEVIRSIARSRHPLSDAARESLIEAYRDFGSTTDQLLLEPARLNRFQRCFEERSSEKVSGVKLVQELIRMRKQGTLPRQRKP